MNLTLRPYLAPPGLPIFIICDENWDGDLGGGVCMTHLEPRFLVWPERDVYGICRRMKRKYGKSLDPEFQMM